jgi:hypothetical protein
LEKIEKVIGEISFYEIQVEGHEIQGEDIKDSAGVRITPKPWFTVEYQGKCERFIVTEDETGEEQIGRAHV